MRVAGRIGRVNTQNIHAHLMTRRAIGRFRYAGRLVMSLARLTDQCFNAPEYAQRTGLCFSRRRTTAAASARSLLMRRQPHAASRTRSRFCRLADDFRCFD